LPRLTPLASPFVGLPRLTPLACEHGGDVGLCASRLKTPSEALRRHVRVLGLDCAKG
jgi:hypothetical protein